MLKTALVKALMVYTMTTTSVFLTVIICTVLRITIQKEKRNKLHKIYIKRAVFYSLMWPAVLLTSISAGIAAIIQSVIHEKDE